VVEGDCYEHVVHHRTARGCGLEIARQALERGDSVAVTARNPRDVEKALSAHGDRVLAVALSTGPLQGRQVRMRGTVEPESRERSAADLLARAPSARAEVLLGQSRRLDNSEERDRAFRTALARIQSDFILVSPEWTLYTLVAVEIEFWQAGKDRIHKRLRYERPDRQSPWERPMLWP
jgi:pyridoxine/pyridoxamine 5'-phosphate oxidase